MKAVIAVAVMGMVLCQHARAQFVQANPVPTITMNFGVSDNLPGDRPPGDLTAAVGRLTALLYDIVNRECAVLTEAVKLSCKVARVNVNSNVGDQRFGSGVIIVRANANATFEFSPLPSQGR